MRSKFLIQLTLATLLVGTILAPNVSFAEREDRDEQRDATTVCGRFDGVSREMLKTLSERGDSFDEEDKQGRGHIENDRMSLDSLRSKNRIQGDTNTERQFKVLEKLATTDASRAAVRTFQSAVSAALTTRRLAFDRALAEYRAGLDRALEERKARIDAAQTAMKQNVESELARMKAECSGGAVTTETRSAFISSLRSIQGRFQFEQRTIEGLAGSLNDLVERKQEAISQADAALRAALAKARSDFEAAFVR
jgi:hypothetical protein